MEVICSMTQALPYVSAQEAVSHIQSGNRVFAHGSAATPVTLLQALVQRASTLIDVQVMSISLHGIDLNATELEGHLFINSLFVSGAVREAVNATRGDYVPVFLSEIPRLFKRGILPIDVALIHVSPPDAHGFCSLGTSVDVARAAVENARMVIAQVNPHMPRLHGDGFVHVSRIHYAVAVDEALPEVSYADKCSTVTEQIGMHVAELVEDGSTLQLGIGCIPDAVLGKLGHLKHLGIHTEMFSDGVMPLIQSGVIDNSRKKIIPGYCTTGFLLGSRALYDFVDDNPLVKALEIDFVNDPRNISQNPKVVAINSAIEIDLTGQVCSDSIGSYQYSGIGGQLDFIRGASLSEGGKPIIAIPSVTNNGISRIVPFLKQGAGVVTTRGDIHWVVTEYGKVNLYGLNMQQRAKALISIAHPEHKETLEKALYDREHRSR